MPPHDPRHFSLATPPAPFRTAMALTASLLTGGLTMDLAAGPLWAQASFPVPGQAAIREVATAAGPDLPEAPQPQNPAPGAPPGSHSSLPLAPRTTATIRAGMRGGRETIRDKEALGLAELANPYSAVGMVIASGYAHLLNGQPNYGTDKGAFGQRLGAAVIRNESQTVFTYMVFAPLLHQDERYYVQGPAFSPAHRLLHAVENPFVSQYDNGHRGVNAALLLGYAAAAGLTSAYYPSDDRNVKDVLSVYGGSLGGAALGTVLREFKDDIFRAGRHRLRR